MAASRWLGRDRLRNRFRKLPEIAKEEARKGIGKGADELVAMMKRLAPRDDGDLIRAIRWFWTAARGGFLAVKISASSLKVRYAHLVEFGTAPHKQGGRFKGTMHPGTSPQPFFYPSYRALKRRLLNLQRGGFRRALRMSKSS